MAKLVQRVSTMDRNVPVRLSLTGLKPRNREAMSCFALNIMLIILKREFFIVFVHILLILFFYRIDIDNILQI